MSRIFGDFASFSQNLTVKQLNSYIKAVLENDLNLASISVEGEISNFRGIGPSGHAYFSLKDSSATVKCVIWSSTVRRLTQPLANGKKIIAHGKITLYEPTGEYQLIISRVETVGEGNQSLAFEQLKQRLSQEGLFNAEFKKEIPPFAKLIGVVTAENGAAIQDIRKRIHRKNPFTRIVLYPAIVQGKDAPKSIISGIDFFNRRYQEKVDVIIVGRGGGSAEDLAQFNDEGVVRAIFASEIPIISAVGHETDFTLSDFVSDLRALTPTDAADRATFDYYAYLAYLNDNRARIEFLVKRICAAYQRELAQLQNRRIFTNPASILADYKNQLEFIKHKFQNAIKKIVQEKRTDLDTGITKLEALSPLKVLARGWSVVTDKENKLVHSIKQVKRDDVLRIRLDDGKVTARAIEVEHA